MPSSSSSSSSSISFNIFMDRKKRRSSSSTTDDLATVKAAAWAWYQHGSESEGKPMREFDVTRTHHHHQTFKPSRYKLEAMKKIKERSAQEPPSPSPPPPPSSSSSHKPSPVHAEDNLLLDAYEIERISKQLDYLLASSSNRFSSKLFDRDLDRQNSSNSTISSSSDIGYSTSATTISSSLMKKNKKFLKGLLMRHTIVCGTREDVDSRALRPVPVPGRHVPVVRRATCRPRAAHA